MWQCRKFIKWRNCPAIAQCKKLKNRKKTLRAVANNKNIKQEQEFRVAVQKVYKTEPMRTTSRN